MMGVPKQIQPSWRRQWCLETQERNGPLGRFIIKPSEDGAQDHREDADWFSKTKAHMNTNSFKEDLLRPGRTAQAAALANILHPADWDGRVSTGLFHAAARKMAERWSEVINKLGRSRYKRKMGRC